MKNCCRQVLPAAVFCVRSWFAQFARVTSFAKNAASQLFRCCAAVFAHEMALPSYLPGSRFSCKHEICSQKGTSELRHQLIDSTILVVAHGQPKVIVIIVHILADRYLLAVRTGSVGAPDSRVRKAVPLFLIAVPI